MTMEKTRSASSSSSSSSSFSRFSSSVVVARFQSRGRVSEEERCFVSDVHHRGMMVLLFANEEKEESRSSRR